MSARAPGFEWVRDARTGEVHRMAKISPDERRRLEAETEAAVREARLESERRRKAARLAKRAAEAAAVAQREAEQRAAKRRPTPTPDQIAAKREAAKLRARELRAAYTPAELQAEAERQRAIRAARPEAKRRAANLDRAARRRRQKLGLVLGRCRACGEPVELPRDFADTCTRCPCACHGGKRWRGPHDNGGMTDPIRGRS